MTAHSRQQTADSRQRVSCGFSVLLLSLLVATTEARAETALEEKQQDNATSAFIANDTIVNADIKTDAAIATSKLSGAVTSIVGHGLGGLATKSAVASADITDGEIVNVDVSGTANIATSKLSGAVTSIVGHGLGGLATLGAVGSAEITDGAIVDADVASGAAIAQSKIANLTTDLAAKFGTAGGTMTGALNLRKTLWVDRLYESSNTHLTRSPHEIGGRSKGDFWVEAGTDALPVVTRFHTSLVYDGKMWVIGGISAATVRKVYSSTDGITWTEAGTDALPFATNEHTSLVYDGKMWVIGGDDGTTNTRKVYSSTNGSTWTEAGTDALPVATHYHSSLVYDGKMWVIGGITTAAVRKVYSSTDGITWTEAGTDALLVAANQHASLVYDGKMWVIGGNDSVGAVRKVYSSTDGITWTEAGTNALPAARAYHTSLVYDGKMWVIGGYTGGPVRTVYSSTDGSTWTEAGTNALPVATRNHSSLVYDGKMWVIGGETGGTVRKVYHTVPTIRGGLVVAPGKIVCGTGHTDNNDGTCTATFYPDADPETTSVDGNISRNTAGEAWATIRGHTDGANFNPNYDTADHKINSLMGLYAGTSANTWAFFVRSAFLFDTSSISGTVQSATFSFTSSNVIANTYSDSIALVSSNPASNIALSLADYDTFGATRYAPDKTFASLITDGIAYNDMPLNAAGIAAIAVDGITKLGMRSVRDLDNLQPATWVNDGWGVIYPNYAEQTGTSKDPKLVVTYTSNAHAAVGGQLAHRWAGPTKDAVLWMPLNDEGPPDSFTTLLLHMDGANGSTSFTDSSASAHAATVGGNAQISTAQSKFGGGAGLFDGTDDQLAYAANTDFDLSAGNWTIEAWIYYTGAANGEHTAIQIGGPTSYNNILLHHWSSSGKITSLSEYVPYEAGWDSQINGLAATPVNTWKHWATVRSGDTITLYEDGVSQGTNVSTANMYTGASGWIARIGGNGDSAAFHWKGYLDEVRISKGIARWTANFTPPSAPYSGTTAQDWTPYGNDGTLTAGPTWVAGKVGQAVQLDGTDDHVLASGLTTQLAFPFTVAMWVKTNVANEGGYLFAHSSTSTVVDMSAGTVRAISDPGTGTVDYCMANGTGSVGTTWTHVAVVWNSASSFLIYTDGKDVSGTITGPVHCGTWNKPTGVAIGGVGAANGDANDHPAGTIDEVRVYNRALSAAEIRALYEASK